MLDPKKMTILLVDDEPDILDVLSFEFERLGCTALCAENGRAALEIVRTSQKKIDAVISDVRMPSGDGVELLDGLRKLMWDIPVVLFITAFADITTDEAYEKGVDAIFQKPFDRKQVVQRVSALVQSREVRWSSRLEQAATRILEVEYPALGQASIGRGGMFLALAGELPRVGENVSFLIRFGQDAMKTLRGTGTIRWTCAGLGSLKRGCGVEFTFLEADCRAQVIEHIAKLQPTFYIPRA